MGAEIFHSLKKCSRTRVSPPPSATRAASPPSSPPPKAALDAIALAVKNAGYQRSATDVKLALDSAASEFYDAESKKYVFKKSDGRQLSGDEMVEFYRQLVAKYPIASIEDGCQRKRLGNVEETHPGSRRSNPACGDDIFVTNTEILARGIKEGVANSILVKVNQIGSLTETLDAVEMAKEAAYTAVISHRSGETEDATIADIAVATNAGQIKTGSLCRTDRVCKYNSFSGSKRSSARARSTAASCKAATRA